MAFIEKIDLTPYIEADDLSVISQAEDANITATIESALEEMAGYLRPRYDVTLAFAATGSARDKALLQKGIDLALFHLHKSLPSNMVPEKRLFFYQETMVWLKDVAKGIVTLDLAAPTDEAGDEKTPLRWGSNTKISEHGY